MQGRRGSRIWQYVPSNDLPITFPKNDRCRGATLKGSRRAPFPLQEGRTKSCIELPIVVGNFFALTDSTARDDVTIVPMGVGFVGVVHVVVVVNRQQDFTVHAISIVPDVIARRFRQFRELS